MGHATQARSLLYRQTCQGMAPSSNEKEIGQTSMVTARFRIGASVQACQQSGISARCEAEYRRGFNRSGSLLGEPEIHAPQNPQSQI